MIPEELDEKTITDIVIDVFCAILSIVVLDICLRNIVRAVFNIMMKIGS